jgi:glucokinase
MSTQIAIGIDFGGTSVKPGVVSGSKIITRSEPIPTRKHDSADGLLAAVFRDVAILRKQHPEVCALGAGLPGIIDGLNGRVRELSNVPGWHDVPLAALLREKTKLPSIIENDANAMAYAEWRFGAGRNRLNVICMTLGTGVGGGLILDGKLFRGSQLGAGEIGQMIMEPHGVPGHYGNFGALEKYVGNRQIAERAQKVYTAAGIARTPEELTPLSSGPAFATPPPITIRSGFSNQAMLVSMMPISNPISPHSFAASSSPLSAAFSRKVFEPIKRTIRERTSGVYHEHLEVVPAELGNDGGIIGSAALAVDAAKTFIDLTPGTATFFVTFGKKSAFSRLKRQKLACHRALA